MKLKEKITILWAILKNNLGLKLIALGISLLIWFFVTNNNDPIKSVTISGVPITIVNEDSIADIGKVVELVGNGNVTVKVTERKSVVNKLNRTGSNFYVEANLENINAMNTVPLTITCDSPQVSWDEMEISPSSLKVNLQDKREQAFAVNVSVSGEPAEGYTVAETELAKQRSVLIAGPETLLDIINQVTAPISVAGLEGDAVLNSELRIFDKNGSMFTEAQMRRLEIKDSEGAVLEDNQVTVAVNLWEVRKEVPLEIGTIGHPKSGYYLKTVIPLPSVVNLMGSEEAMRAFGNVLQVPGAIDVTGRTESFSVDVDISEVLDQYEDVEFLSSAANPVIACEVVIERTDDITIEVPLGEVVLSNKPTDKKLVFTPADKITLQVRSESDDTEQIDMADVEVSVDLSICKEAGTYALPVEVSLPDNYQLSSDVFIKVYSTDAEEEAQPQTSEKETE